LLEAGEIAQGYGRELPAVRSRSGPSATCPCHDAWDRAADRTAHGTPIALKPEDFVDRIA